MAHFPIPGPAMRAALALILALGYAAALTALVVFLSGRCATDTAPRLPGALAHLALFWVAFASLELPATFAGPGARARLFKRAAFAVLVAGAALSLLLVPATGCGGVANVAPIGTLGLGVILALAAHLRTRNDTG